MESNIYTCSCPDAVCRMPLYFTLNRDHVVCSNCGQTHSTQRLKDVCHILKCCQNEQNVIKKVAADALKPKRGSDLIKVNGLSNYHCKMISPLITRFGMSRERRAVENEALGCGEIVDCSIILNHCSFSICPKHINIEGYGRDATGSSEYLSGLLDVIRTTHGGEERLIPIHADGDGHCLVHALSRAITGTELFWHGLRDNLLSHLKENLGEYKRIFMNFINEEDWPVILKEADPYRPPHDDIVDGLGNIHIFALSNVLKRPIILLDSVEGINNVADYTGIFVPAMVKAELCRGNTPVCIAWSGSGHNHFVPLVGVASRLLPTIPEALLPNVWGIDKEQAKPYLNFNEDGSLTVGGGSSSSLSHLTKCVGDLLVKETGVSVDLVLDMYLYVFRPDAFVTIRPNIVVRNTITHFRAGRIFRCVICNCITVCDPEKAIGRRVSDTKVFINCHGDLTPIPTYTFEEDGATFQCDRGKESAYLCKPTACSFCNARKLRKIDKYGKIIYQNGDSTETLAQLPSDCCGRKHFWDGEEYEKLPKQFILKISVNGIDIKNEVTWLNYDSELLSNSDRDIFAKEIAEKYLDRDDSNFSKVRQTIHKALSLLLVQHCEEDESLVVDSNQNNLAELESEPSSELDKSDNCSQPDESDQSSEIDEFDQSSGLDKSNMSQSDESDKSSEIDIFDELGELDDCDQLFPISPLSLTKDPLDDINLVKKISTGSSKISLCPTTLKLMVKQLPVDEYDGVEILISTSDGRQKNLEVDSTLDYSDLEGIVRTTFFVKRERQILKIGSPPEKIPNMGVGVPIGLKHGDHVTVEITSTTVDAAKQAMKDKKTIKKRRYKKKDTESILTKAASVLRNMSLRERRSRGSVNASLQAVSNMAERLGLPSWEYAVQYPALFRPGGAVYEQLRVDVGLESEVHALPDLDELFREIPYHNKPDESGFDKENTVFITNEDRAVGDVLEAEMDTQDEGATLEVVGIRFCNVGALGGLVHMLVMKCLVVLTAVVYSVLSSCQACYDSQTPSMHCLVSLIVFI